MRYMIGLWGIFALTFFSLVQAANTVPSKMVSKESLIQNKGCKFTQESLECQPFSTSKQQQEILSLAEDIHSQYLERLAEKDLSPLEKEALQERLKATEGLLIKIQKEKKARSDFLWEASVKFKIITGKDFSCAVFPVECEKGARELLKLAESGQLNDLKSKDFDVVAVSDENEPPKITGSTSIVSVDFKSDKKEILKVLK